LPANSSGFAALPVGSGATDRLATVGGSLGVGGGVMSGSMNTTPTRISADRRIGTVNACHRRLISSIVSASIDMVNSPFASHCVRWFCAMTSCVTIGWPWIACSAIDMARCSVAKSWSNQAVSR
jgi:hypothetical protein